MLFQMSKKEREPVCIPETLTAQYTNPDQAERFDAAVRKVFGISPGRAAQIRRESAINPNPRGRQKKGSVAAARVPVSVVR
jgi:hypothetical protein